MGQHKVLLIYQNREAGVKGVKPHPKSSDLVKIRAKSHKILYTPAKSLRTF